MRGWTLRVERDLLTGKPELADKVLTLLESRLQDVERVIPQPALGKLRGVKIWMRANDGPSPCAVYHPSPEWLRQHGWNPDLARGVEICNATRFLEWAGDQPAMVLHELAHAYHHQFLGYENGEILAAYREAVRSRAYEAVPYVRGGTRKAYALENEKEYFAECTEAYFARNDFYPFTRTELQKHDPEAARVVKQVWAQP